MPVCGTEICWDTSYDCFECPRCTGCVLSGTEELFQLAIDGKKAQELLHDVAFIYLESVKADIQEHPINWDKTAKKMFIASQIKQENE